MADETASFTALDQKAGMNFNGHEWAHFSVRPGSGVNVGVAVAAWDGTGWAALTESEATQAGQGAAAPFQFSVRAAGRILLVYTTGAPGANGLDVLGSGWDAHGGAA